MTTQDTTGPLWDKTYKVRYNFFASRSIEDIQANGTPVTGNKQLDNEYMHHEIDSFLNVVKIVELIIDKGVAVSFVNYNDVFTIYDDIRTHLEAWEHFSRTSYNHNPEVMDDLLKLDKLANMLFDKYVKYDTERTTRIISNFSRNLVSGGVFDNDVLSKASITNEQERIAEAAQNEYPSLASFLKSKQLKKGFN